MLEREKEMIDAKQPFRRPLIDVLSKSHDSLRGEIGSHDARYKLAGLMK